MYLIVLSRRRQDENQISTQYGHLALETSNCDRGRYPAAIHSSVLLQTLRLSRSSVEDRGCLLSTVFPPCIMRIEFLWFHELNPRETCKLICEWIIQVCALTTGFPPNLKHNFPLLKTCCVFQKRFDQSFLNLTFLCEPVSVCVCVVPVCVCRCRGVVWVISFITMFG